jgi:glycosyltransferase involved in cell wall biosynthesis
MKILINAFSLRLGGGQTYLTNILKHSPEDKNFKIYLLCDSSLKIDNFPENVYILNHRGFINPLVRACWENIFIPFLVYKYKINVVFSPGGLIPILLRFMRVKTAVTFQNMLPFCETQRRKYPYGFRRFREWILKYMLSSSLKRADLVIFISNFAKNFIETRYKIKGNSKVIYHGIDPIFTSKSSHQNGYFKLFFKRKYFTYVSFIDFYKNQLEVVRGYKKYLTEGGKGKLFLIGSEYKAYGDIVRNEIKKLKLSSDVIMLGNITHNDLPFIYQNASANIFASSVENCPNILLEIMASKKPALVSKLDPMPEIAHNTVLYFDPTSPDDFAKQLANIANNKNYFSRFSKKAFIRSRKYSWNASSFATWNALKVIGKTPYCSL